MGYYWRPYQQAIDDFFEWLFVDKRERKILKYVPRGCRNCEILGICRDEDNNWKCHNGCQFIKKDPFDYNTPLKLNRRKIKIFKKKLPIKRVTVAGSRTFTDYKTAKKYIDFCLSDIRKKNEIIIVSGGAKGSDTLGERYAKQNGFEIERYLADWDTYCKSAGAKRNKKMAEISDYVICFWDGKSKGTKIMIDYAKQFNKPLKIKKINNAKDEKAP